MGDPDRHREPGLGLIEHPLMDRAQVWPDLPIGTVLDILKINHDGAVPFRYPGTVIEADIPDPWIAVACKWALPTAEADGLVFGTGDTLIEFYSPEHRYNAFRAHAPDGTLRGWYANVTYPTVVRGTTLEWHDLWLDLILLPHGTMTIRDQDELEDSGIERDDPELYRTILATMDEVEQLARGGTFPFNEP